MQYWKPHALAKPHADQLDLRDRRQGAHHRRARTACRSAPRARCILANGFNWQRYRVLFDNGVEVGDLDGRQIEPIGRTAKRLAKAAAKAR